MARASHTALVGGGRASIVTHVNGETSLQQLMRMRRSAIVSQYAEFRINRGCCVAYFVTVDAMGESQAAVSDADQIVACERSEVAVKNAKDIGASPRRRNGILSNDRVLNVYCPCLLSDAAAIDGRVAGNGDIQKSGGGSSETRSSAAGTATTLRNYYH